MEAQERSGMASVPEVWRPFAPSQRISPAIHVHAM
jgi:hypothetical protein